MFERTKLNENWRKRYNKELIALFGDIDILSFVRISRLSWIDHVNRKGSTRRVRQVFNNNPQGSRLRDDQKTDGGIVYEQVSINTKLQIGKRRQKNRAWSSA
jgi:hypothetical protein